MCVVGLDWSAYRDGLTHALYSVTMCASLCGFDLAPMVARYTLPAGTTVARYEFRVVSRRRAPPGDYRVDVTRYLVGKLDARSFGPPVEGVANVGPLLNEATTRSGEVTNCARTASELTGSQGHRRGAFFLRTTREVHVGQELMWDYGANYGPRSYQ